VGPSDGPPVDPGDGCTSMVVAGRPVRLTGLLVGATDKPFCITGDPVVPPVPCVPPEVGTVGPDPTRGTLPHGLDLQIDPPLGIDDPPDVPPIGIGGVYGGIDGIVAPVPVVPLPRNVLGSVVPIGDPPIGGIPDRVARRSLFCEDMPLNPPPPIAIIFPPYQKIFKPVAVVPVAHTR
jgi:hypothetical protein